MKSCPPGLSFLASEATPEELSGDRLDGKFFVASIDSDPATVKLKEPTTSVETSIDLMKRERSRSVVTKTVS